MDARYINELLLITALALYGSATIARELPNEVDLRASYCFPILQRDLQVMKAMASEACNLDAECRKVHEQGSSEIEADLHRLTSYLLPRLKFLDVLSIHAARDRGRADVDRDNQEQQICANHCKADVRQSLKKKDVECIGKCLDESAARKRIARCYDLSFLPF